MCIRDSAQTGQRGEAAAAKFYLDRGCRLLTHNFHTRMGELDVVVQEPDATIVICEVKTRAEGSLTTPAEAVDKAKQRRLIRAAEIYLQTTGLSLSLIHISAARQRQCPGNAARWQLPEGETRRGRTHRQWPDGHVRPAPERLDERRALEAYHAQGLSLIHIYAGQRGAAAGTEEICPKRLQKSALSGKMKRTHEKRTHDGGTNV